MPTPINLGNVAFREIELSKRKSRTGADSMTVTLKGAASLLSAELAKWKVGQTYAGYQGMFLQEIDSTDKGVVVELRLTFVGYLDLIDLDSGLVSESSDTSLSSVQLTTSGGDDVAFQYYSQVSTFRWIHRKTTKPTGPRFRNRVSTPRGIPTTALFAPSPPTYAGGIGSSYAPVLRLSQFSVNELARSVWEVTEAWSIDVQAT